MSQQSQNPMAVEPVPRLVTGPENAAIVWWPLAIGEVVTLGVAAALYLWKGRKLVAAL